MSAVYRYLMEMMPLQMEDEDPPPLGQTWVQDKEQRVHIFCLLLYEAPGPEEPGPGEIHRMRE